MDERERTGRFKILDRTDRLRAQMAVIAHPHVPHVLALLVGGVITGLVFVGIVVFEEGGAEGCHGKTGA